MVCIDTSLYHISPSRGVMNEKEEKLLLIVWEISASYLILAGFLLISQFYVKGFLEMTERSG